MDTNLTLDGIAERAPLALDRDKRTALLWVMGVTLLIAGMGMLLP